MPLAMQKNRSLSLFHSYVYNWLSLGNLTLIQEYVRTDLIKELMYKLSTLQQYEWKYTHTNEALILFVQMGTAALQDQLNWQKC